MNDNHTETSSNKQTTNTPDIPLMQQPIADGDATNAVTNYVRRRFWQPRSRYLNDDVTPHMDDAQWEAIRALLEQLYGLDDLTCALKLVRVREFHALSHCGGDEWIDDDGYMDESGYHVVDQRADPALPNGWITLLEASYEQLNDIDGLERLYAYCLLIDLTPADHGYTHQDDDETDWDGDTDEANHGTYLDKLRNLVDQTADGNPHAVHERWDHIINTIVTAFETADAMEYPISHAQAYEDLLIEERLEDAAWRYCDRRIHDPWADDASSIALMKRLLDAIGPNHASDACEILLKPLHDADSALMHTDSAEHRRDIIQTLIQCKAHVGIGRIRNEAERLIRMYRSRKELQESLNRFVHELDEDGSRPATSYPSSQAPVEHIPPRITAP